MCKVVFTVVDDDISEKTTIITEYGPFEVGEKHPVQHLIEWMDNKEEELCQTPKIIT